MRAQTSIAICASGLLCTFLAAPAVAGESAHQFSPTLYWFCQSNTNAPAYSSRVVVTVARGKTSDSIRSEIAITKIDIEKSFAGYLAKVYGYTGLSSCLSNESQYWMDSNRSNRLETLRTHKQPIVETDWTYAAAASAPAAPAPATDGNNRPASQAPATPAPAQQSVAAVPIAPAPVAAPRPATPAPAKPSVPKTPYAACWGKLAGRVRVAYFGKPFAAPVRDIKAWTAAYEEFLHDKYQFVGVVTCGTQNSAAAMQKLEDAMRVNWKIIETGWKYP